MRSYRKLLLVVVGLMAVVLGGVFGGDVYAENAIIGNQDEKGCYYVTFDVSGSTGKSNSICFEDIKDAANNDVTIVSASDGAAAPVELSDGRKLYMEIVATNPQFQQFNENTQEIDLKGGNDIYPNPNDGGARPDGGLGVVQLKARFDGEAWEQVSSIEIGNFQNKDDRSNSFNRFAETIQNGQFALNYSSLTPAGATIDDSGVGESSPGDRSNEEQTENYGSGDDVCYGNSGKLGWIICPIVSGISGVGQWLWGEVETNFLQIQVGEFFKSGGGVESAWRIFRDIANIIFIILFMFVIFSQLTGIGIDNYGIKKIMPKLIVVAILINLSYIICMLAVDLSNILGVGLNGLFSGLATEVGKSAQVAVEGYTAGQSLAALGLGVGTGGIFVLFTLLTGPFGVVTSLGALAAVGLAVLGIIITVVVSILFLFLILLIRNAGIVILIAIAPVAIVCYMLPNTEKLYKKWFDLLKALLLVYPICGAMVGAGKLAGIILASTGSEVMSVAGMIIEVLPFFLIPVLLKQSLALMGNVGARLSGVGKTVGRGLSSKTQGAIQNSRGFKDFSQYQQDAAGMRRATRIRGRLQKIKDRGGELSARDNEKLLKATETMNTYNQRRAQGTVGDLLIDQGTMEQKMRAQQSNTLEKMYTDNYAKMTDRGAIETAFNNALAGDNAEDAAAAMNVLMQKGGTTEVLNALSGANWSTMNTNVKKYLTQAMGASNVDALKGFSKYQQTGGQASFSEWSTGTGATIAAEASNGNIKAKSYAQHLMEGGENAMTNYSKDEMQFVERNADAIRAKMQSASGDDDLGRGEFGAMLKNAAVKSGDAKTQTVAENTIASQLGSGGIGVNDLKITAEDIGNMRGKTAEALQAGMAQRFKNATPTMSDDMAKKNGANALRISLSDQVASAKTDPMIANKMKTETRTVFVDPI